MDQPNFKLIILSQVECAEAEPFKALTNVPTDPVAFWSGVLDFSAGGKHIRTCEWNYINLRAEGSFRFFLFNRLPNIHNF